VTCIEYRGWVYAVCCCMACEWHNIELESGRNAPDAAPIPAAPVSAAPQPCDEPQQYRCSGAEFQRCTPTAGGSDWIVVETCASAEACGPIGGCVERQRCVPGENVCVGPQLQRCGENRFDVIEVCAGAEYCALDGCRPSPCEAGQQRCNGFQIEQCKLDRSGWEVVHACEGVERCDPELTQCIVHPCNTPDAVACNGGLLELCINGGWLTIQDCGRPELCGEMIIGLFGNTVIRTLNCLGSP